MAKYKYSPLQRVQKVKPATQWLATNSMSSGNVINLIAQQWEAFIVNCCISMHMRQYIRWLTSNCHAFQTKFTQTEVTVSRAFKHTLVMPSANVSLVDWDVGAFFVFPELEAQCVGACIEVHIHWQCLEHLLDGATVGQEALAFDGKYPINEAMWIKTRTSINECKEMGGNNSAPFECNTAM
jgi:hypothetical protein